MKTLEELEASRAGLDDPTDVGRVDRICLRMGDDVHTLIEHGQLSIDGGLEGDRWLKKETPQRHSQLTVINTAVANAFGHAELESYESGDNFQVTLDISEENLPTGTRLRIGEALIEVTAEPHRGCKKFKTRFGRDALEWVQMKANRPRRLRGLHAEVIEPGRVRVGDPITVER